MTKNKKNVKKNDASNNASFKKFGLSDDLLRGIVNMGYTDATAIQNKAIPPIINGRNVLAMAPTGSGKTAAFLIPMLHNLRMHSSSGTRAVIISPTRELACQTLRFTREMARCTNLQAVVLLGGSAIEEDFASIEKNPDIIIGTPGRLLHLKVEMGSQFNLSTVEYIVFDEGDRLFEMDMAEQLSEILRSISPSHQTVVFSATLPSNLTDFAQADISNPMLIKSDVYNQRLNEKLTLCLFYCATKHDKIGALLEVLDQIGKNQQVLIFFSTKHHILYVSEIMDCLDIKNVVMFSDLEKSVRQINTKRFLSGHTKIMLVTDLAARGIDIPHMPYVINFNFPDKPKLFQHRVGRVARAGNEGTAISLIEYEELPYLLDTCLYLNRPLKIVDDSCESSVKFASDNTLLGTVPNKLINAQINKLTDIMKNSEVISLEKVMNNSTKKFNQIKAKCSSESYKRSKILCHLFYDIRQHPFFNYNGKESDIINFMRKRLSDSMTKDVVLSEHELKTKDQFLMKRKDNGELELEDKVDMDKVRSAIQNEATLDTLVKKKNKPSRYVGPKYFINDLRFATKSNDDNETCVTGFTSQARQEQLDIANDNLKKTKQSGTLGLTKKTWDRKKRKFVGASEEKSTKKIKTDSGVEVSASFKTGKYQSWLKKGKNSLNRNNSQSMDTRALKKNITSKYADKSKSNGGRQMTFEQHVKKYKDKKKQKDFQKSRRKEGQKKNKN